MNQTKERNGAMKKLGKTVAAAVLAAAVLSTCALAQEAGISEAPPAAPAFTDVAADAYYADAAVWAVEQGITSGTSDTTFSPDAPCTRAQMVTFLCRDAQGSFTFWVPERRAGQSFPPPLPCEIREKAGEQGVDLLPGFFKMQSTSSCVATVCTGTGKNSTAGIAAGGTGHKVHAPPKL